MALSFTQMLATPRVYKIGDREYRFTPFRVREWGELELWIHDRYVEASRKAFEHLSDEAKERAATRLAERLPEITPMSPEGMTFMKSPEGAIRMCWLSLRPEHPEITVEEVEHLLMDSTVSVEAVMRFIDQLNGAHVPKSPPASARDRGKARRTTRR